MLENKDVKLIPIDDIVPNRFQPRQIFGERELNELANSIKEHGIIQPLILRPLGNKFEIIAGERRFKAASIAGLSTVPAIIVEKTDNESAELAIIENIQRKDLTPIEEAKSYRKLVNKGLTQEEIAQKLGVTQPTIANKLRLLNLTEEVQDALLNNKISERHARGLLRLEEPEKQINMLNRIINEKLNVKQTDEEIDKLLGYNKVTEELEVPVFEEKKPVTNQVQSIEPIEEKEEEIEILSPFSASDEILNIDEEIEKEETLFKPIDEDPDEFNIVISNDSNTPEEKYRYLDIVNKAREFIDKCKSKGSKISLEEYDMDEEYQIIIKIEK